MKSMTKALWLGAVIAVLVAGSAGTRVKAKAVTKDIVDTAVAAG